MHLCFLETYLLGIVACACNPSTKEAVVRGLLPVLGQPGLPSKTLFSKGKHQSRGAMLAIKQSTVEARDVRERYGVRK